MYNKMVAYLKATIVVRQRQWLQNKPATLVVVHFEETAFALRLFGHEVHFNDVIVAHKSHSLSLTPLQHT